MNTYRAFGCDIASEVCLPELLPAPPAAPPSVSIRIGSVERFEANVEGTRHNAGRDRILFSYCGLGRFRAQHGREIVVDPEPAADPGVLRVCLLGPVFAAILHQRGLLALHASAVVVRGTVSVFLGAKGWGKSTLAAWLRARGNPLLADDIAAVDVAGSAFRVLPGFPQLKLWPSAAERLGLESGTLPRLQPGIEKRAFRFDGGFETGPALLGRIYVLDVADRLAVEPLDRGDAFSELVRHTYLARYIARSGASVSHFRQCASVAKSVPVFRVTRPPELGLLDEAAALLESHGA